MLGLNGSFVVTWGSDSGRTRHVTVRSLRCGQARWRLGRPLLFPPRRLRTLGLDRSPHALPYFL
jgi:hypothetical protein